MVASKSLVDACVKVSPLAPVSYARILRHSLWQSCRPSHLYGLHSYGSRRTVLHNRYDGLALPKRTGVGCNWVATLTLCRPASLCSSNEYLTVGDGTVLGTDSQ